MLLKKKNGTLIRQEYFSFKLGLQISFSLRREVTWEDLAFFNADLFEGLSRMILDGAHPMMTSERFQATYCCHFEVRIPNTQKGRPGGELIPSVIV